MAILVLMEVLTSAQVLLIHSVKVIKITQQLNIGILMSRSRRSSLFIPRKQSP